MHYDFETLVNRTGTGSSKWEGMKKHNPNIERDIVPLSVADMELKNAPEIIEGLQDYLGDAILGYTTETEGYLASVTSWMERRHNWKVDPQWIVTAPGVVPALGYAVQAFTKPGDGVIINRPVYYPFSMVVGMTGRKVVNNPLIHDEEKRSYTFDLEDLRQKAADPANTLMILCSPHNPVGRVWTREELTEVGRICQENNVILVVDEIHQDFVMPGHKHTVLASICPEFAQNTITCSRRRFSLEMFWINSGGRRPSGVMACSRRPNRKSRPKAISEAGIAPSNTRSMFWELSPRLINQPRPPAPAKAAMVMVPTAATAEMRMPDMIKGSAMGISMRSSRFHLVMPIPFATSMVLGSMLMMPVYVFLMIGKRAYTMTIRIAGLVPMPTKGTEKASSAIQGMDCMTLAAPMTTWATGLLRVMRMPTGTPIAREIKTASVVIFMCSMNSSNSSILRSRNSCTNSANDTTPLFCRSLWCELPAQDGEHPPFGQEPFQVVFPVDNRDDSGAVVVNGG